MLDYIIVIRLKKICNNYYIKRQQKSYKDKNDKKDIKYDIKIKI